MKSAASSVLERIAPTRATYWLAALTIIAALLRIFELGYKSLWLDEVYTADVIRLHLWEMLKTPDASHVPLYYIVMHEWSEVAGRSEAMLRLPSAVFAIATIPLIYQLGAELADQSVGPVAALFFTVNATCVEYAQDARAYALLMMMGTLAAIFFVRSVKRSTTANLIGYTLASVGSIYAHLFATLLIPAQWISIAFFDADRKTIVRLFLCAVVIGLLVLPVLVVALITSPGQLAWVTNAPLARIPRLIAMFAGVSDIGVTLPAGIMRSSFDAAGVALTALYLLAIGAAIAEGYAGRTRAAVALLASMAFFPIPATLLISLIQPIFVYRYMLMSLPPFVVLAAIGVMSIPGRALRIGIIVAIATLGLGNDYFYFRAPPLQDWRAVVHFLTTHAKSQDLVFVYPAFNALPISYYVGPRDLPIVPRTNIAELEKDLGPHRISSRVWLVYALWYRLPDAVTNAIRNSGRQSEEVHFSGVGVIEMPAPETTR